MKEKIKAWLADEGNQVAVSFAIIGTILLIAFCLTSCRTVKVVTETHTEYVHDTTQIVDSIWRDRWHTEYQKGDTIYLKDSVYVYKYKYLDKVKEVYVHDSIPYPVEVVKEVHKRSGYDKFVSAFFWVIVAILVCICGFWVCDKIPVCKPYTTAIKAFFKIIK